MNVREYIRNPLQVVYLLGIKGLFGFLDDEHYVKLMYRCKFNKRLNLEHPETFDEKIQWLKLYDRNPDYTKLVDKYEVKDIVAAKIGTQYIIPTIGVWDSFDEINFDELPNSFVLKCTHDSGGIVICKDKSTLDMNLARRKIEKSLKRNYYKVGREWQYKNVPPRIIAETLIEDSEEHDLRDYKVFVFNGIPKMVQVDIDRFTNHRRNLYDTEWNYIPAEILYPTNADIKIQKPECLDRMLELAAALSENYPFVRVDFYLANKKILFGELTFLHGSGFEEFRPKDFGMTVGSWLTLPDKEHMIKGK